MSIICKDYSREPVPAAACKGSWSLFAVQAAFFVNVATLVVGAQIGINSTVNSMLVGSLIGGVMLACIAGGMGYIGAREGLTTVLLAKRVLGTSGGSLVGLLVAIAGVGWFGVQTEIFANSLAAAFEMLFGLQLPNWVLIIFGGLLMTSTAVIGFGAMERLSWVAAPLLVVLLVWPVVSYFFTGDSSLVLNHVPAQPMSVATIAASVAGGWIVGAVVMPDIMRYAKTARIGGLLSAGVFFVIVVLLHILAAFWGIIGQSSDVVAVMLSFGLGLPALLTVILATWTTNDSNMYVSSLCLAGVLAKVPKWLLALLGGMVGTGLALAGILSNIIPVLLTLGVFAAPVGGVLFAALIGHSAEALPSKPWRVPSLCAWLAGVLVGLATSAPESLLGFGLFTLTTIPLLDALIVAALVQFILNKVRFAPKAAV